MTKERLEELKRITDAATPGPWIFERVSHDSGEFSYERNDDHALIAIYEHNYEIIMKAKFDSELISASRTAIPELITAYEKAVGMLKVMEFDVYNSFTGCSCCSFCQKTRIEGHAPDCELNKILGSK